MYRMSKIYETIIAVRGISIFGAPAELRDELLRRGVNVSEAISAELILSSCPSVGAALMEQDTYGSRINMLISDAVNQTNLSPATVRRILSDILKGVGKKAPTSFHLLGKYEVGGDVSAGIEEEAEICSKAASAITGYFSGAKKDDLLPYLADLEALSKSGNAMASNLLGKYYYYSIDRSSKTPQNKGLPYFRRAASQGFAPAYSALAWYAMKGGSMARAAKYFEHPGSLGGSPAKEWSALGSTLLSYRNGNKTAYRNALVVSALSFFLSLLVIWLMGMGKAFVLISLLLELGSVVWCLLGRYIAPYLPLVPVYFSLMLSWLIQVACLF